MNPLPTRILVATDGSEDAILAAQAAADVATKTGARLHVLYVWKAEFPKISAAEVASTPAGWYEQQAGGLLAEQVELIEDSGATVTRAHLRRGRPAEEIAGLCEELGADLLVVGSRRLGTIKRLITGSVSERVVRLAPCPILIVRGGEEAWPPDRLLIGDDGSEEARRAGELAARIGQLFGIEALLVRVYPNLPKIDAEGRELNPRVVDDELRREERKLKERATEIEEILGSRPKVRLTVDGPTTSILEAAHDEEGAGSTLVAVGSRGLGPVRRRILGSVSTDILGAASGSVLVVPLSQRENGNNRREI